MSFNGALLRANQLELCGPGETQAKIGDFVFANMFIGRPSAAHARIVVPWAASPWSFTISSGVKLRLMK
jgi:hypothetical protein